MMIYYWQQNKQSNKSLFYCKTYLSYKTESFLFNYSFHCILQKIFPFHPVFLHTAGKRFAFQFPQMAVIYNRFGVPWQPRNPWK